MTNQKKKSFCYSEFINSILFFLFICNHLYKYIHDNISQESIAAEFLDKLVKWAKNIKVSDPLEEGCKLGPVVSGGQVGMLNF